MFKNYFKITLRNLWRDKFYSLINIIGLSIGIICSILIFLYVQNELSYDRHYPEHERIYRLESNYSIGGKQDQFAITAIPLAPTLQMEYPEVEGYVRFFGVGEKRLLYGENKIYDDRIFVADSTVFDIFGHKLIAGNAATALIRPSTIVITETLAEKLFGKENPVGEIISTGEKENWEVTGVMEDLPQNTHLRYSAILSVTTITEQFGAERFNDNSAPRFWNISCYSYIRLAENADINNILLNFPQFYEKYMKSLGDQINASFDLMVSPIAQIHYSRQNLQSEQPKGNIVYIYTFIAVAIFLLLIACINYMNMATARASNRAKEVGIRKTMGADRPALIRQFLSESMIITLIALIISLVLTRILLPIFNEFAGKTLDFNLFQNPILLLFSLLVALLVGFIAGSYPAFYLSSFQASRILKGELTRSKGSGRLRMILVVLQFVISIVMIFGTLTVRGQLRFMRDRDLGFTQDNLLYAIVRDTAFVRTLPAFIEDIKQYPEIKGASTSTGLPSLVQSKIVFRVENEGQLDEQALNLFFMDYDLLELLEIDILQGRNYQRDMGTDLTEAFIINQAAAEQLNWGDDPLGKRIQFGFDLEGNVARDGRVIGVTENFNYRSLHNKVEPLVMLLAEDPNYLLSIRVSGRNQQETIQFLRRKWQEYGNSNPFNYHWLSDSINESYVDEQKLSQVFSYFSILCIFIACLGLLGLSAFVAERRTKEIGTRKVLGASIGNIIYLLSRDFILLVIIANLVAQPLAHFTFSKWLQNFAYRTDISVLTFVVSAVFALLIALATVSLQALRAATANPVDSLRYE